MQRPSTSRLKAFLFLLILLSLLLQNLFSTFTSSTFSPPLLVKTSLPELYSRKNTTENVNGKLTDKSEADGTTTPPLPKQIEDLNRKRTLRLSDPMVGGAFNTIVRIASLLQLAMSDNKLPIALGEKTTAFYDSWFVRLDPEFMVYDFMDEDCGSVLVNKFETFGCIDYTPSQSFTLFHGYAGKKGGVYLPSLKLLKLHKKHYRLADKHDARSKVTVHRRNLAGHCYFRGKTKSCGEWCNSKLSGIRRGSNEEAMKSCFEMQTVSCYYSLEIIEESLINSKNASVQSGYSQYTSMKNSSIRGWDYFLDNAVSFRANEFVSKVTDVTNTKKEDIFVFTDGEHEFLDSTFGDRIVNLDYESKSNNSNTTTTTTNNKKNTFQEEVAFMTSSLAHYGVTGSSVDYVIAHWRDETVQDMFPGRCWGGYGSDGGVELISNDVVAPPALLPVKSSSTKIIDNSATEQAKQQHTVVTAYFKIPSKHTSIQYDNWMTNMLSLLDPMVIFCSPEYASVIRGKRKHLPDSQTVIVERELVDTEVYKMYPKDEFWEHQLQIDSEKDIHQSYWLFIIWLNKISFVNEAIRLNPFNSDVFVWSDIGCFRNQKYNNQLLISHPSVIPATSLLLQASLNWGKDPENYGAQWLPKLKVKNGHNSYVAGALMCGHARAWRQFNHEFMATIKGYVERDIFMGDDQVLIQSTCSRVVELCEFVLPADVPKNKWFGLQFVLSQGGVWDNRTWNSEKQRVIESRAKGLQVTVKEDREDDNGNQVKSSSSSTSTIVNKSHCINNDFTPKHAKSVWTMLNDNPSFVLGAIKLGLSIQKHSTAAESDFDLVVMELASKPLPDDRWVDLKKAGFMKCQVASIPPPAGKKTRADLREKFAVLHVFGMIEYETVLFLDADTFVVRSIDHLLKMNLRSIGEGKKIGVAQDIRDGDWASSFNSGVMILHPDKAEYERLIKIKETEGFVYESIMSDQGFLNAVYKDNWHDIGFENNANSAAYKWKRGFWDEKFAGVNIIHFTMQKPWKCGRGGYAEVCQLWMDAPDASSNPGVVSIGNAVDAGVDIAEAKAKVEAQDGNTNTIKVIGYAISLLMCGDHQTNTAGLIDSAAVFAHSVHRAHSTIDDDNVGHNWKRSKYKYKLYALVHRKAEKCSSMLSEIGYAIKVFDDLVPLASIRNEKYRKSVQKDGCCGADELLKLYMYSLADVDLVVHVDLDVVISQPLDNLYDAMLFNHTSPIGKAARDLLEIEREPYPMLRHELPGTPFPDKIDAFFTRDYPQTWPGKVTGLQAGLLVLRPSLTALKEYAEIIAEGNYMDGFNNASGWGAKGYGGAYGAKTVQGVVPYYYDIIHPGTAVELNGCVYNHMNANVMITAQPNYSRRKNPTNDPKLCRNGYGSGLCEDCFTVHLDRIKTVHYTNCRKPWACPGGEKTAETERNVLPDPQNTAVGKCDELHLFWNSLRKGFEDVILKSKVAKEEVVIAGAGTGGGAGEGGFMPEIFLGHCKSQGRRGYIPVDFGSTKSDLIGSIKSVYNFDEGDGTYSGSD